ncbi:MAG TPA: hypothetical protein VFH08_12175 [Chitinophagaceae bacterium]|nr:hypothetical protein [Chitinophagaceae bacterium]
MRKIILMPLLVLALQSCLKDNVTKTYSIFEPVYKSKAEVFSEIKSSIPVSISNPGKIYMYGNYIFLNEINKGVHIIDNSNPASPSIKAFINIPGNVDIAVKGSTLYADLFTDLVVVDISNPLDAALKKVISKIFPERVYAAGFVADSSKVIVGWTEKKIKESVDGPPPAGRGWIRGDSFLLMSAAQSGTGSSGAPAAVTGIAGSMSRFSIVNNYLYAVNNSSIKVLDISAVSDPQLQNTVGVGWNIETIYPFKNKLFLGSSNGMFIFDITNPVAPVREGSLDHFRACDPVVADDDYAFVTLRAGTWCQGTSNQLDVVNVQNVQSPWLVKTYGLTNPHGLAKDGDLLFVCDGRDGLKVYNKSNVFSLQLLSHIKNIETFDVIAWNNRLLLVAKGGLYQYNYSNPSSLSLISKLTVNN